jgi:hypothetical protein
MGANEARALEETVMVTWLNGCWLRSLVGLAVGFATILACAEGARGQVAFELFHAFVGKGGAGPTSLIQASDGNFYGTTSGTTAAGVAADGGTVFKLDGAGTLTTLGA